MSNDSFENNERPDPGRVTGYFVPLPSENSEKLFDIRQIWRQLMQMKLLIAGIVIGATLLAFLISLMMTPIYRSSILLAPNTTNDVQGSMSTLVGQYGGLAPLAGVTLGGDNSKDQAIAILRSRRFTEEFIASENLMPILFSKQWDEKKGEWRVDDPEDAPTMADAYQLFDQEVRIIQEDNRRGLVTLSIEWSDRELAANWANLLVERLNRFLRGKDIKEAQRSIEFLNQELEKSSVIEIRQGIFRLIENQIELIMLANVQDEYAFKILDPAVVSDEEKFVQPKRRMMTLLGFLLASFLAIVIAMVRSGQYHSMSA